MLSAVRLLRLIVLIAVLVAVYLGGCAGRQAVPEAQGAISQSALRSHLRTLTEPPLAADSAQAANRARYAAGRMRASGLMPVKEGSFLIRASGSVGPLLDPSQAHVLGYVAGRHPSHASELVLVAASRDGAEGMAALEMGRILADEARFTQVPERSVLIALWASPPPGARGLQDYLANPTWALEHIHRVLLVSADTAATRVSRRLLDARGIASEVVTVRSDSLAETLPARAATLIRAARLTEALLARTRAAATDTPN